MCTHFFHQSLTRIVWGMSMLIVYIRDIDMLRPADGGLAPIYFLLLLILCEIAPILILMDYSFLTIFDFDGWATREMPEMPSTGSIIHHESEKSSLSAVAEPLLGRLP